MNAKIFSDTLNTLMGEMSESALAREVNVPKATINRLLSGRTPDPRASTLAPIAQYFGVSIDQLLGLEALPENLPLRTNKEEASVIIKIPMIEMDSLTTQNNTDYATKDNYEIIKKPNSNINEQCYLTKVNSSAMRPKFIEGAFIVVNPLLEPENNDFVIFHLLEENSIIFRQLLIEGNDKYLSALNPDFKSIYLNKPYKSCGVVIESRVLFK